MPRLSGIGFIVTGLGGPFAGVTLLARSRVLRIVGGLVMLVTAAIRVLTGYLPTGRT